MRKTIISFVLLILFGAIGSAETVLIYVGDTSASEEEFKLCLPLSSALEDGVMNEFFDNGHIVFNAGIKMRSDFPEPPFESERLPVRIAKAGGAAYLLEIKIQYILEEKEGGNFEVPRDLSADFIFSHVTSERVLQQGGLGTSVFHRNGGEAPDPEKDSYILGQMIAKEALSVW